MGNKLGRRRQVIDEKYTRPQGLYHHKDVDHKKLKKLILESKLAPCFPGDEECTCDLEECPICFLVWLLLWLILVFLYFSFLMLFLVCVLLSFRLKKSSCKKLHYLIFSAVTMLDGLTHFNIVRIQKLMWQSKFPFYFFCFLNHTELSWYFFQKVFIGYFSGTWAIEKFLIF